MESYKSRIIEIIHRNKLSNVPELSHILGISKPAVQYHMQKLLLDGEIEVYSEKIHSVGRPINYYRLSGNNQPDNLSLLADALLIYVSRSSEKQLTENDYLSALAMSLANTDFSSMPMINRIDRCVDRLNEMNYQSHWEVTRNGSCIRFRNCPYKLILSSHPELCRMDKFLLEHMIGRKVEVIHLQKDNAELHSDCKFFFNR